jgi:hypothetical protein
VQYREHRVQPALDTAFAGQTVRLLAAESALSTLIMRGAYSHSTSDEL